MIKQEGSILLVILFFFVFLSLMATAVLKTVSLLHDAAVARYQYQNTFLLTKGLMNCAYAFCTKNINTLVQKNKVIPIACTLDFPQWPPLEQSHNSGKIEISTKEKYVCVHAILLAKNVILFKIEALLEPHLAETGMYLSVAQWHIINT